MAERVTLITGASAGIGTELARLFASNGHKTVLVARREERLAQIASAIAASGGILPIVMACDLEAPDGCDKLAASLAAQDLEVEIVVNNAGFGLFGQAVELDRQDQLGIVALNVRAVTDLSLRFSDSIIRNKGGILNVASIAGFLPGPGMAVYYASKAYVLSFTEALHAELSAKGVRVTTLCPGPVPTEFQARAGFVPGMDSTLLSVSAQDVAKAAYDGFMANKCLILPGLGIRVIPFLLRFVPRSMVIAAVSRVQRKR
ncbi:MAG: SDR family oxidoreductase [Xanthobacteraceae bacterium]|nr:SDR family oxidoreductase [Xanthobacteraceae bacterium]